MAGLGEIVDFIPKHDALGVHGLDRAPVPDDIEIVKALVVDIVGFRLAGRLVLRRQKVVIIEGDVNAEIVLRAQTQLFQQRYCRAKNSQAGPASQMQGRSAQVSCNGLVFVHM